MTENNPKDVYCKIIFEDHSVLVSSLNLETIYYGRVISTLRDYSFPFPKRIVYEGEGYSLLATDYQIVTEICFGNPLLVEGEVKYADYVCDNNMSNRYISLAVVSRTNERADVLAQYVSQKDLRLERENA